MRVFVIYPYNESFVTRFRYQATDSSCRTCWTKAMEQRLSKKLDDYREEFNQKIEDLSQKTDEKLLKSEDMILSKFKDLQVQSSEDIKNSFGKQMQNIDNKLDMFMKILQNTSASTRSEDTTMSVSEPGKGQ